MRINEGGKIKTPRMVVIGSFSYTANFKVLNLLIIENLLISLCDCVKYPVCSHKYSVLSLNLCRNSLKLVKKLHKFSCGHKHKYLLIASILGKWYVHIGHS